MPLGLSDNSLKVLEKRYLKKDEKGKVIETPEELFTRVAKAIASSDRLYGKTINEVAHTEKEFYSAMANLEFMPNSPTLMNAGRDLGQLSACFVVPVGDTMDSIFDAIKATALIHKTGGGTGFSFSNLRPKNSVVKTTGGVASGPVSFLKVFDAATQAVKQGGTRRGANMGILRIDHPDILEFITCKENNKEITNFNISVAVTEDFMKKLEKGENYDLIDPHTNKGVKTLNTREVFELIVSHAHKNGEPGVIFIDRMNDFNPTPKLGRYESTNPCVVGNTLVATEKGLMKIKNIASNYASGGLRIFTDTRVLDIVYDSQDLTNVATKTNTAVRLGRMSKAFKTGTKKVFKIVTDAGYELVATSDHKIMTLNGWVKVSDLKPGIDKVFIQPAAAKFNNENKFSFEVSNEFKGANGRHYKRNFPLKWSKELGEVLGWLVGDGWLREGKNCCAGFTFSQDDKEILSRLKPTLNNYYNFPRKEILRENNVYHLMYNSKYFVEFFKKLGVKIVKSDKKEVPEAIFTATEEAVVGFLQALFSADGTVGYTKDHNSYIRLTAKSLKLLKGVQLLLLNLGIKSKIYNRDRKARQGFEYITKSGEKRIYNLDGICFELSISKNAVPVFLERVGFLCNKHSLKIKNLLTKDYYNAPFIEEINTIDFCGEADVYDLTEDTTHSFIANGIVISNCGEQVLLPYESCNLGSINLREMIIKNGANISIDWERLKRTIHTAVHFLDNVIDANKFPLKEIEQKTKLTRKVGLGLMGWASFLVKLGIPYDSDEAVALAAKVMSFIQDEASKESVRLAKERGIFPAFKDSIYDKQGRLQRNATLTTIAPTGTISIIAGPTSSGIEPLFAVSYYRTVMDQDKLIEVDPDFEEVSRIRGFYSRELMEKIAECGSIKDIQEIPEDIRRVFVTALDIAPQWHVKMQAAFQKFTDNAVSKTVNFPYEATISDVNKVYNMAYSLGCKGITIYRDRSREEQVLNIARKEQTKPAQVVSGKVKPRPRPEVICGTTTKVTTGCGNLYVTINTDEQGRPFELFTQMGKAGGCASSQLEALARMVSLAFRSAIDVKTIVDQLRNIRCPSPSWEKGKRIFSCADAIARVIEQRITNGTIHDEKVEVEVIEQEKMTPVIEKHFSNIIGVCPDCGGSLRHEEGCIKCQACGFSKC